MKKHTLFSITLIIVGFALEYLYLGTDKMIFMIKFWLLGISFIFVGTMGLFLYTILPLLEYGTGSEKSSKTLHEPKANKSKQK